MEIKKYIGLLIEVSKAIYLKITNTLFLPGIFVTFLLISNIDVNAQRLSRDLNVDILVNQAGYLPSAYKRCIVKGSLNQKYQVINIASNEIVFTGMFRPISGDFGEFSRGDFSAVAKEGFYYILSDTLRSYPFRISKNVYESAMSLIVDYFSKQRCGGSTTGYLTPCHLDDGVRMDNGKHQDVSGGWHDASDLRKWVGATIYGVIGMAKVYELYPYLDQEKLIDELLWGNRYFLNMQESEGYIMSYVGGDVIKHSDSNRWTDNIIGEENGDLGFTKPNSGQSTAGMLVIGTKDDRVIKTDPLDFMGQYNFVTAEAIMSRITKKKDIPYSDRCLEAAQQCFTWCKTSDIKFDPGIIGASIQAAIELYKTTGDETYIDFATNQVDLLRVYQHKVDPDKFGGFFYLSSEKHKPYNNIWNGSSEFYALCDLAILFPEHKDAAVWKDMIALYARNYLQMVIKNNNFGIAPYGVFKDKDPGGNRKIDEYWYRYFMQPELDWWVGVNSNLASIGIGMIKAAKVLADDELKTIVQRQLDWIIGVNPFNSSTLIGVGYNHPKHFPGSTFNPRTPVIPGAVMNGLGGDHNDQPVIGSGSWQISEYWTPMVAHTMWLMAELSANP